MLLQVHDELIFEVPEAEVDDLREMAVSVMQDAALPAVDIAVPLIVDANTGSNWDEAH
jgi:DNA polymerase-1